MVTIFECPACASEVEAEFDSPEDFGDSTCSECHAELSWELEVSVYAQVKS